MAGPFGRICSLRTVVIGPVIHWERLLLVVRWADDAHRAPLEHVGIDHCGVEI